MYVVFEAVYTLGNPLQDDGATVLEQFKTLWVEPLLLNINTVLQSFIVKGVYEGVGTVSSFLPIILLLFLFMGIVENSG